MNLVLRIANLNMLWLTYNNKTVCHTIQNYDSLDYSKTQGKFEKL